MSAIDFLRQEAAPLDLPHDDVVSVFLRAVAHAHSVQVRQLFEAIGEQIIGTKPIAEIREFFQGVALTTRMTREEVAEVLVTQALAKNKSGVLRGVYWGDIAHEARLAIEEAARKKKFSFDPDAN